MPGRGDQQQPSWAGGSGAHQRGHLPAGRGQGQCSRGTGYPTRLPPPVRRRRLSLLLFPSCLIEEKNS